MRNYPLRNHNTFGLDVSARNFLEYSTEEELLELIRTGQIGSPFLHIGGGSNLLFTHDYPGTILHSRIHSITVQSEDADTLSLRVGAGVTWDDFVNHCVTQGWQGVENLSLIPGEVGAAAVQNIGAYGMEAKDVITSVETIDITGRRRTFAANECNYAYRHSLFKQTEMKSVFITYVNFRLNKTPHFRLDYGALREALRNHPCPTLATIRETIIRIRQSKLPDPKILGNAGSFFMNPVIQRTRFEQLQHDHPDIPHYEVDTDHVKIPAGWLIEQCGWRGKHMGPTAVYDKQALVLVNTGGATGSDIVRLATAVQMSVKKKFDIEIQPEVIFI